MVLFPVFKIQENKKLGFWPHSPPIYSRSFCTSGRKLDPRSKWGQVFCALDLPVPDKARALLWREVKGLEKITQRRVWRWEADVMCELGS